MSYILDALKKSEAERKQGDVPNLQTVHIPINTEQPAPVALYGLIAFLLLVLAFVIGWLFANKESTDIVQVIEPIKKIQLQKSPIQQQSKKVPSTTASQIKPVKLEPIINQRENAVVIKTPSTKPKDRPLQPTDTQQVNNEQYASIPDLSDIPYLHELPDYQQQSIPQMTFAGHVYSSNSASRSVIINDAFMSEGDALLPGVNIVEITRSGVVFSLHDDFFRVDILQDWSFE